MEASAVRAFRRLAFATTGVTYFLIFLGGLVRVSGAGMGCPDWPKCYGLWIPPTDVSQLPSAYDPAAFNPVLTWIEYINRLFGVLTGFFILATLAVAVKNFRKHPQVLYPSIAAFVLVAFQGWLGKVVVKTDLNPFIVTLHLVLALIIVSILIYITQQAYFLENPKAESASLYPSQSSRLAAALWGLGMLQLAFGTQVREKLEWISRAFPLMSEADWVEKIGNIGHLHGAVGIALTATTWVIGYSILRKSENASPFVVKAVFAVMGLSLAEVVVGLSLVFIGVPAVMQIFHQWTASLYIGLTFALYSALRFGEQRAPVADSGTLRSPVVETS